MRFFPPICVMDLIIYLVIKAFKIWKGKWATKICCQPWQQCLPSVYVPMPISHFSHGNTSWFFVVAIPSFLPKSVLGCMWMPPCSRTTGFDCGVCKQCLNPPKRLAARVLSRNTRDKDVYNPKLHAICFKSLCHIFFALGIAFLRENIFLSRFHTPIPIPNPMS